MARRCSDHNRPEPCFYCERGIPPFTNIESRLLALEDRVRELELHERTLFNLDIRRTHLVIRMGGIGDLVMLSSSLKALKEKFPADPVVLSTMPQNMALLSGASFLDGIIPVESWGDARVQRRYDLRYAVEPPGIGQGKLPWEDYIGHDRSDLFDRLLGVVSKKEFSLPLQPEAKAHIAAQMTDWGPGPFIGLSPTTKSPLRVIPPAYVQALVHQLGQFGKVVLLGKTEKWNSYLAAIEDANLVNLLDRQTIPELIALVDKLDLVISPDSAVTHIAGALKTPCLALFGNIRPGTRITYYPTVRALYPEDELACIPCWDRATCTRQGFGGDCMKLLTPERIVNKVADYWQHFKADCQQKRAA